MFVDRLIPAVTAIILTQLLGNVAKAVDVDPLAAIPGGCNAVAIVQMKKLVNSPLGRREKWFDEAKRAYAEGLLSGPPWVREIVHATTVAAANGTPPLTYSIYTMDQSSIISQIAKHELGQSEKVDGRGAVVSPRNILFIQLGTGVVGAIQPANRDAGARWVQLFNEQKQPAVSPALVEALKSEDGAQVAIAIDLKGKLNPRYVLNWFLGTPKLRATDDLEGLAKVLSSLKMARLAVHVTDAIVARLSLDFDHPVGKHQQGLEKAISQWLDDAGARPHALAAARITFTERSLTFEVPLDDVGLRRLLSLIQSPQISPEEVRDLEHRKPNAIASAAYYNKVCDLLNSLLYKNRDATEYGRTALWHEQFAKKIAGLPTTAVDPALVRWGRDISKELHALAMSLRGEAIQLSDLERSIRSDDTVYYNEYAYSSLWGPLYAPTWIASVDNLDQVRGQQDAQIEKSAGERDRIWNMLYQETGDVARQMESKYGIKLKLPR